MSVRNSFASLDESDDDEPRQQVKTKAKTKAKTPPATAPARNNNRGGGRRDDNRRDNRGRRGEYNRDVGDSNSRKYRRDDRRTDRRRDAERRDRRRDGGNNQDRRGRNQYEKTHQKRGPKKAGHGGWGTDKDAVDVVEEETPAAGADTPTEEGADEETPSEPAAPAVRELTLEEHEAAEKERRAKFNERWGSTTAAAVDVEKEFSGMTVVSKKKAWAQTDSSAATKKPAKSASRSAQKAKELKKAIFAEPKHDFGGRGYSPRGDGRGRGRGRGGRGRREFSDDRDYGGRSGGYNRRGGRGGRGAGRDNRQRTDVNTQDVNEFPALA